MAMTFVETSSQYIALAAELAALRTTASISFWVKTTQVGNDTVWDSPGVTGVEEAGADDDIFWGVLDNNSGNSRMTVSKGNGSRIPSNQVNDGGEYHIVMTWDSSTGTCNVYQNGVLITSGGTTTGDITNTFSSLARVEDTGGTPRYLDGTLDDVRVYDRVLTAAEAAAIHAQHGGDSIVYGLVHRWLFDEDYPGQVASGAGQNIDVAGGNDGTPTASPVFAESSLRARRVA